MRCAGHTKSGKRCRRRTSEPLCSTHVNEPHAVTQETEEEQTEEETEEEQEEKEEAKEQEEEDEKKDEEEEKEQNREEQRGGAWATEAGEEEEELEVTLPGKCFPLEPHDRERCRMSKDGAKEILAFFAFTPGVRAVPRRAKRQYGERLQHILDTSSDFCEQARRALPQSLREFEVLDVLGRGTTGLALRVRRNNELSALKVAILPENFRSFELQLHRQAATAGLAPKVYSERNFPMTRLTGERMQVSAIRMAEMEMNFIDAIECLDPVTLLALCDQIAALLARLHGSGSVKATHGDMHFGNIMLRRSTEETVHATANADEDAYEVLLIDWARASFVYDDLRQDQIHLLRGLNLTRPKSLLTQAKLTPGFMEAVVERLFALRPLPPDLFEARFDTDELNRLGKEHLRSYFEALRKRRRAT